MVLMMTILNKGVLFKKKIEKGVVKNGTKRDSKN
jgi:hypothetical protein